jgi:hypothetical protein
MDDDTKTYKIFRSFHPSQNKPNEDIRTGCTLEEVKEHCCDPDSRSEGEWADHWTEE